MVYTVTFNPALDYMVRLEAFHPGETNRAASDALQPGGKGINVSTVLHRLGIENIALGFLAGFTGMGVEQRLQARGVQTDFIWLPKGLTRINVKIKAGLESEINAPGPEIPAAAQIQLFEKLDRLQRGDVLVLAGSIPPSLPDSIYRQILKRLDGRGILSVVDATRELLREVLPYHPFLIKPNSQELSEIFGRRLDSDAERRRCARQLQEQGARNVLVSMAGEGSLLLDETGCFHRLGVPKGTVRNSVGAGDAMVAGFLAGWLQDRNYAVAHRLGAAAGSATAYSDGLATAAEIQALLMPGL